MDYECKLASFDKIDVSPSGVCEPLCNDCQVPDCTNPIEERTVVVFGIPKKMRLWVVNNVVKQVLACKGYIGLKDVMDNSKRNAEAEGC